MIEPKTRAQAEAALATAYLRVETLRYLLTIERGAKAHSVILADYATAQVTLAHAADDFIEAALR